MAESETSSCILIVWLAPEQQFEKVVLWPTPKAGSGGGNQMSRISGIGGIGGRVPARGVLGCRPQ